jgi:hypothetical protein
MASITKPYDIGLKSLLYSRFKTILGIDSLDMKYGIIQCPEEIALREFAERRGDNWLDFISFYRTTSGPSWSRQRSVLANRGVWLAADVNVTAQPIDLGYFATFWSKDLDKLYEVVESYILWQHDFPKLTLTYADTYPIEPDLHFGEITDESTYTAKYDTGVIFAFRMPIKVDGWVLQTKTVEEYGELIEKIRLTVYDSDDVVNYETIYVPDSSQDTAAEAALRFFRSNLFGITVATPADKSVTVGGNRVTDFTVGDKLIIQGSTGNNGMYTLVSATLIVSDTKLVFEETIASSIADGVVFKDG